MQYMHAIKHLPPFPLLAGPDSHSVPFPCSGCRSLNTGKKGMEPRHILDAGGTVLRLSTASNGLRVTQSLAVSPPGPANEKNWQCQTSILHI